jgi:superfamily II DNA helicase RecQ
VGFTDANVCRHRQVAEHFGEAHGGDCGMCDVCAPEPVLVEVAAQAAPLPEDVGAAILEAVRGLRWPLGRTGLLAMLRGSVSAPPSARRSPAYGLLAAARQADVKRWVQRLEDAGALETFESDDGFKLLRAVAGAEAPRIATAASPDEGLFERLRTWRGERARADAVPAYVVLHDATLREVASAKPSSHADLATVKGLGPTKLERYGDEILAIVAAA